MYNYIYKHKNIYTHICIRNSYTQIHTYYNMSRSFYNNYFRTKLTRQPKFKPCIRAVCISQSANTLGNGIHRAILPPSIGKIVG